MYENPGNNSNNGKMAIEKNQFIKHKPISDRLKEHFRFKLLADGNIKNADTKVLFVKCRKLIGHFKHSPVNTTELQNYSDSLFRKLQ